VAEGDDHGVIWRMSEPAHFPDEQRVNPTTRDTTDAGFTAFRFGGRFTHQAIAFSADKHFAYLADAAQNGSLYRLDLAARKLTVLHHDQGWLDVVPEEAVQMATRMHAATFAAIADIELLPDGTLLLAESGTGQILKLDDRGSQPRLESWLKRDALRHPGDMSWDASRQWLWITDTATPSTLWAWDGQSLHEIMHHPRSRFSGVLAAAGKIFVNLQLGRNNPSMTFILKEHQMVETQP